MKVVNDSIKNVLKQPTTQRKGRILVDGNYYDVFNVEYYADAYNEGNVIGNAIASQLDFDLPYMDKFETFKYYDGVWTGAEYEYVDFGTFTVFDEQDEDEFNKHITAFDNLIKFNKQFEDVGGYPKTLYQELKNICNQAEVELENASIPNGNFIVENNQFVEGENLKTVLKAIEQISGTYGIIKNDKLVLQLKNQTTEKITKNEHEPITWKRRSYGINQVILGMEDVKGEYVLKQDDEDIAINGVHKLVINDNPFVYTQQKREEVIEELFNQVKGFGYVPYDLKMEWLNYMDIGDTITIDGVETLILRMYGKSPKSLESEISAPAIIDSAIEYSNNTFSLSKRVSRTEFGVDKNAREIQAIVETTETIEKEINPTKDESGSEITIEDASNNPLTYLEIEGKSTQETRSGKNKLYWTRPTFGTIVENEDGSFNWSYPYAQNLGMELTGQLKAGTYTITNYGDINLFIQKSTDDYTTSALKNGGTKTFTYDGTSYLRLLYGASTPNVSQLFKLQLEEGSTSTDYEPYGVSPSPDYPSEIESVGYENLFDKENITREYYINSSTGELIYNVGRFTTDYIPVKSNKNYVISGATILHIAYFDDNKNYLSGVRTIGIITIPSNVKYIRFSPLLTELDTTQIEKGSIPNNYIPYGKYGIEVETTGRNIWDEQWELGSLNLTTGEKATTNSCIRSKNYIPISPNTNYYFKNFYCEYCYYDKNLKFLSSGGATNQLFTTPSNAYYMLFRNSTSYGTTYNNDICINISDDKNGEYTPYKNNTSLIVLNAPLRSLPNGVKDIAYIRNNKLYVDRYVGSVVLNGSENWIINQDTDNYISLYLGENKYNEITNGITNYFGNIKIWSSEVSRFDIETFWSHNGSSAGIKILKSRLSSVDVAGFKKWLSTHNTQVDYELAEPYTEELGEIETLTTLKGYNKIKTTDDLEPTLNIQYIRDTVIADYVENHVAELKINEEQIKQSVETVSSSVDGLTTDISRVEQITTDNSQVLNIISTNIDKSTGEVREVTTTTGFTFNAEGSSIKDSDGFEVLQTPKGAYYKDNGTITGQYTKDGSKQKDLELFGTYSYGKTDIDDTPMFVGQLYTDENGEECFGHFVNI